MALSTSVAALAIFLLIRTQCLEQLKRRIEKLDDQKILGELMKNYDWKVRPPGINKTIPDTGGPVVVRVNILIRSVSKIDDVNMEYAAQLTFREEWMDERLGYENRSREFGMHPSQKIPPFLILPPGEQIWMPDTFFQNEKEARKHLIDKPNVLIRIYKNGHILYSVRVSLVLSCPMYLQDYPLDVQNCVMELGSYAYTTDDIEYKWKEGKKPIQLKTGLNSSLPSFSLEDVTTSYCTSKTNTGSYSCLRTTLTLKRQFSYYLLQLYIPSSMLVIVSWVSFWLDRSAVPARVTLGVTTLLTMTTQAASINAKLPPVSYLKAVDVWISVCLSFIFGALLEFAYVTYVGDKDSRKSRMSGNSPKSKKRMVRQRKQAVAKDSAKMSFFHPRLDDDHLLVTNPLITSKMGRNLECECPPGSRPASPAPPQVWLPHCQPIFEQVEPPMASFNYTNETHSNFFSNLLGPLKKLKNMKDRSRRTDFISRLMFPLMFALFNLVYWCVYRH